MKNKIEIIVIITLILISILISGVFIPYINNNSIYVVVEDKAVWRKFGNKWTNLNIRNLRRLSFEQFDSFSTKEYIGKTYLDYEDSLNVYSSDFEKLSLDSGILSIKTKFDIKNKKSATFFNDIDDTDYPYVQEVLEKYNLLNEENIEYLKYTIDINNDGEEDTIYSMSNFYNESEKNQAFSILFSVINDNIEIIESKIVSADDELNEKSMYLRYVVDVDNDDNLEIVILKTAFGDVKSDCYTMYKYDITSNKYIKLIGC